MSFNPSAISIHYYVRNSKIAIQHGTCVPRTGDLVRLYDTEEGKLYRVQEVVWHESRFENHRLSGWGREARITLSEIEERRK